MFSAREGSQGSMKTAEARLAAEEISGSLKEEGVENAYSRLLPLLNQRIPFRFLDIIGEKIGSQADHLLFPLLEQIAADGTEGGWVVIASALHEQVVSEPARSFVLSRDYIILADVWYGADIIAERVPGPILVDDFEAAIDLLDGWRFDPNRWVRRAVGVAAHYWAKRAKGDPALASQASRLLHFLDPMFSEWEMDATKGVAWGLKTLGRYYPGQVADWLILEILPRHPKYRVHMLKKATLFLPEEQRGRVIESLD